GDDPRHGRPAGFGRVDLLQEARRRRREEGAAGGDRQRREQPSARRRSPGRRGSLCGRQLQAEALPRPRQGPRRPRRAEVEQSDGGRARARRSRGDEVMGQKVNLIGLRVGINRTWDSRWFAGKDYAQLLHEDLKLKEYLRDRLAQAGISKIVIERPAKKA